MYQLNYSTHFKKNLKRFRNDREVLEKLNIILEILIRSEKIPDKYLNHGLRGQFRNCFECHIKPGVLLVYKIKEASATILLLRIGSHSDIF